MSRNTQLLVSLVDTHSWITAAWFDDPNDPHELHLVQTQRHPFTATSLPAAFQHLTVMSTVSPPLRTLIAPATTTNPSNAHHACQDEPIELGCQCQPVAAAWVGTAGAPVSWKNAAGKRVYGVLSNWHVLASGQERLGRTIHQPTVARGTFAILSAWKSISPNEVNTFDAALADALVNDYHTISSRILKIGDLCPTPIRAVIGIEVCKSGRTTGLTCATCTATGAAVRVSYGDFTATFEDQDIYMTAGVPFSAPGDSGSLIVDRANHCPVSLLFAGNSEITIGNPIRHVVDHFGLSFNLN